MWEYKNYLEFPVSIKNKDLKFAKVLVGAIGNFSGELGACLRYFMQANTMKDENLKKLLIEIATEEMAHCEILAEMLRQLTKDATVSEYKELGLEAKYAENKNGIYPINSSGAPFTVSYFASTGDVEADLNEDMAAEAKAKASYESLMDLTDNKDILAPLSFLRQREIIHYQRFAEALKYYQEKYKS